MRRLAVALALWLSLLAASADVVRDLVVAPHQDKVRVGDSVLRTEVHVWRYAARAGQRVALQITSNEGNAVFDIWRPGATLPSEPEGEIVGQLLAPKERYKGATRWSGKLPEAGTYLIVVGPTRGNATYKLTLKTTP